jgi:hypothetical protein
MNPIWFNTHVGDAIVCALTLLVLYHYYYLRRNISDCRVEFLGREDAKPVQEIAFFSRPKT